MRSSKLQTPVFAVTKNKKWLHPVLGIRISSDQDFLFAGFNTFRELRLELPVF
jgi:hypothetical protein